MIYMTFKQWEDGNFLETGEPRKNAYSKAELDLVEMGWNYGYDAGVQWQKSQQALDRMADNERELGIQMQPEPEPVKVMGFDCVCGRRMVVESDNGIVASPPKREWQGLTDWEINSVAKNNNPLDGIRSFARAIEAKLKEKNHDSR
jgi:hypothetical protein